MGIFIRVFRLIVYIFYSQLLFFSVASGNRHYRRASAAGAKEEITVNETIKPFLFFLFEITSDM